MDVGFVGLGSMGAGMARTLLQAGHRVAAYNRSPGPATDLARDGASIANTPAEAARSGVVISMLADDHAVEAVTRGDDGILRGLPAGGVHVSMSTIGVATATTLAEAHAAGGQALVAAPVFGRPEAAAQAQLVVAAAGADDAIARVRPLLEAVGRKLVVIGTTPSQANAVKLAGNYMIACAIEALAESTTLLSKHGVAPAAFVDLMTSTLFAAPAYQIYGKLVVDGRYTPAGFKLPLGLKDVRLVLQAAEAVDAPMPFASVVRDQLLSALARGYGELDWSALALVAAENAGVKKTAGDSPA